ncbi:Lysophospholipid acyltransferase 7 [Bagarius yarrelli]|uniref:Leukocyte receptor cluster member 4 n=1 Tax=Bagarius yarrelli TaxID=175774 RepID=A0A556U1G0_BAGYA|nr:Lysophospholipid acyltransferase 7 [Bagarius yarrelli]
MSPDELVYMGILAASIPESAGPFTGMDFPLSFVLPHGHMVRSSSSNTVRKRYPASPHPEGQQKSSRLRMFLHKNSKRMNNRIVCLRVNQMVSLAYEVQSYHLEKKKDVSSFSKSPVIGQLAQEPSLYDVISYSYCYVGIMTGFNFLFPLSYVRTDDFLAHNFFFRFFYMVAVFFVFRMRFYSAWCGAEAGCITAGLGCYPQGAESKPGRGPSVQYSPEPGALVEYDFKTIQNIDCYNTDFCVKVRHGMRYWNMTVQWWLHEYIYSSAPFRAYALRAGWTMLVSAYWHGLHLGYYLSFLTIPVCIAAELAMESCVRSRLSAEGQKVFDWVHWFLKMRAYDYMCMGFVLLKASDTLHYWSSIYFIIHAVALICIAAGQLMGKKKKEGAKEESKK